MELEKDFSKDQIMDKQEFLKEGLFQKEPYEGLLVNAKSDGGYNIGIQLEENTVLKVDEATEEDVRDKIYQWSAEVSNIQRNWKRQSLS